MKEYEEKAVSLALNRSKLQDLTDRLKAARLICPLFDTARWVSRAIFMFYLIAQSVCVFEGTMLNFYVGIFARLRYTSLMCCLNAVLGS